MIQEQTDTVAAERQVQDESTAGMVSGARTRSLLGYVRTVLLTLLIALLLKAFVVEAFRIPSSSMENTLVVGDFLLVNKLAYGIRTPRHIPLTDVAIPTFFMPAFQNVQHGDVVVFEYPGFFDDADSPEYVNYIKRCVGLPGDVVEVSGSRVLVNGVEMVFPPQARTSGSSLHSRHHRSRLFPRGAGFTEDAYGPLVVPRRGDVLTLTASTVRPWQGLIRREGHSVEVAADGRVLIDGQPAQRYTIKQNYYFVMGDNRYNSLDSRYWGFVPEENLIGEALMVYWSWDPDVAVSNVWQKLNSIRWDRIGALIR